MKKSLIYSFFLLSVTGYTQNTFPTGAGTNVGIGTTSPTNRLQVTSSTSGTSGVRLTNMTSSSSVSAGNSKALSVDSSGNIILTPVTNTSLYSSDGTLSTNRVVKMNSRNMIFEPTTSNSHFFINGVTGDVGIGSSIPSSKLDVNGSIKAKRVFATNTATVATTFSDYMEYRKNTNVFGAGYEMSDSTFGTRRMLNFYDLNEWGSEISASNDLFLLNVVDRNNKERLLFTGNRSGGSNNGKSSFVINDKNQAEIFKIIDNGDDIIWLQMGRPNSKLTIGGYSSYSPGLTHKFVVQDGSALIEGNILTNSNIGIGTSSFLDGSDSYRLSVDGAIRAHRVRVYTSWADYVFAKDYKLPTLDEVEKHIFTKGHLIDIPSAKEVEQNGIELGEMNKLLLQKIEELTLYMIELNKEITTLKNQINN